MRAGEEEGGCACESAGMKEEKVKRGKEDAEEREKRWAGLG